MKIVLMPLLMMVLVSAGCDATDEIEEAEHDMGAAEETSEESDGQEEVAEEEQTERPEEERSTENYNEETPAEEESTDEVPATVFDINDSATQEMLLSPDYQPEADMTFEQDVITAGMTQAEVEEQYGGYDSITPGHGRAVTIYDNLGVVYSVPGPYGEDELATTDVDPDEVVVEDVMYYAGLTYDAVVSALGEPDVDVYEPAEGPAAGYQFMEYIIEEGEDMELVGMFWMYEGESGDLMVDVMTKNEQPADINNDDTIQDSDTEVDGETEERLTSFMGYYLLSLEDYYNDENDEVFNFTEPSSENGAIIADNKASGNFSDHENHDMEILNMEESDFTYMVEVSREYSHATSQGARVTTVQYEITETPQGFKVLSFEELNDQPAD